MDRHSIETVVEEVVRRVLNGSAPAAASGAPATAPSSGKVVPGPSNGVHATMDEAVKAADRAFAAYLNCTLAQRETFVQVMRRVGLANREEWSKAEEAETKLGRWAHKVHKLLAVCNYTPGTEDLTTWARSGDNGLTIEEMAPYGVIAAVTPSTHPCATLINNGISFLASGNVGVFNAHPASKGIFATALATLNEELRRAGAPDNLLTTVAVPTIESANDMFAHPLVRVILVTGGPAVVKAALAMPKKAITAGPGNPPVVVDETADLAAAAKHTIAGASFDNNVLCIGEKEVFCVASVFDRFKAEMVRQGCVELNASQIDALAAKAFQKHGDHYMTSRDLVGRNASVLAAAIGLTGVSDEVPLLIGETNFQHLWVQEEQLMPFLPLVRCKDVDEAIRMAVEAEHGYRHTAVIHSKNIENMTRMARAMDCSIFIKNGPSYAGLGYGGEGYCSYSIASPTGEGITSARTFTRKRRCTLVDYFRII